MSGCELHHCSSAAGPFLRAPQIKNLSARVDDAAVNSPGNNGRNFSRHHRHHRFIEQRNSACDLTAAHEHAPLALQSERSEIAIPESQSDRRRLHERRVCRLQVALLYRSHAQRQQQIALLDTIAFRLEQTPRSRQPSAGLRAVAAELSHEAEPSRTTRRAPNLSSRQVSLMRARQYLTALRIFSNQVSGSREKFQVFRIKRSLTIGLDKLRKSQTPSLFPNSLARTRKRRRTSK